MLEQQIFHVDALAGTTGACIIFFAVLTLVYSWKAMPGNGGRWGYNLYLLLSLATALGAVLTGHLVV
jgi:formate hydrogenlyase subunit 3/multisubunit Na+/H+ antiporter MnhD subunit